jgi:hypothetical protein
MSGFIRHTTPANVVPKGYEQVTAITVAKSLDPPVGSCLAWLQAEVADVRLRDDGTDPLATVGIILVAGASPIPYVGDLEAIRVIQAAGGAILNVLYFAPSGN